MEGSAGSAGERGAPGRPAEVAAPRGPRSARGEAAAGFVAALGKAARALALYDPSNSLVRQFLVEYRSRASSALLGGPLALDVQPFELTVAGEAIYREEDRERSIAFRLFRDGVRRITVEPDVPWGELVGLLEPLAVHLAGIEGGERDLATDLADARFTRIDVQAVAGFAPEEDDPEPTAPRGPGAEPSRLPADFDTPFPLLPAPGPIAWRPLPPEAIAGLAALDGPQAVAGDALRIAAALLAEAERGAVSPPEVARFLGELRDFVLADGALGPLAALAELVARQPAGPLRDGVLRALGDRRVLAAALAELPPGVGELTAEAARVVPLAPAAAALDLLADEGDPARRRLLLSIAAGRLPGDAAEVVARLPALAAGDARVLFRAVGAHAPAHAASACAALLEHPDLALRLEGVQALAGAEGELPVARLLPLLAAPEEELRIAVADLLARRGDDTAFPALAAAVEAPAPPSRLEAAALGRALAQVHPARAAELFGRWLERRRGLLLGRSSSRRDELRRWAAVAGLGAHPAADAGARIEEVAASADGELRRHCAATLARRRQEGFHG